LRPPNTGKMLGLSRLVPNKICMRLPRFTRNDRKEPGLPRLILNKICMRLPRFTRNDRKERDCYAASAMTSTKTTWDKLENEATPRAKARGFGPERRLASASLRVPFIPRLESLGFSGCCIKMKSIRFN
jgi:hypothetical protein